MHSTTPLAGNRDHARGLLLVAFWTWKAPRIYQSSATVRIDNRDSQGSILKDVVPLPNFGQSKVMTEMEVLRSRLLAENVARRLNMNVDVVKPAAGGGSSRW
jgi:uncharacterized protein involved in exopolysaccharide biosynthesis